MRNTVRELLRVSRVDPVITKNPKVTQYVVTGRTVDDPPRIRQVSTINAFLASTCKRGLELSRDVWIDWKADDHFGPQLRRAELDETKFSHDL